MEDFQETCKKPRAELAHARDSELLARDARETGARPGETRRDPARVWLGATPAERAGHDSGLDSMLLDRCKQPTLR